MSVPNTRQMKRRPTHPGEMLREDFMPDYGLTVVGLAESVGVGLWDATQAIGRDISRIKPLRVA